MEFITVEKLEYYLNNKTTINSSRLKKYLFKFNIKKKKCESCKMTKWLDKNIPLELHHVDGNNKNNHIFNLQILCPNCHAQTENYRGSHKIPKRRCKSIPENIIVDAVKTSYNKREALLKCGLTAYGGSYERITSIIEKHNLSFLVKENIKKIRTNKPRKKVDKEKQLKPQYIPPTKIDWPEKEELENMIKNQSLSSIAKLFGVSDNAVRNRAKKYGIDIKSISKWSQKHGDSIKNW
jgi:hypothetical protein